jgi:aspartate-semialdehyde dehydrogenase
MDRGLRVAVVGATGAVGQEFLHLFEGREFPVESLALLASARSAGRTLLFRGQEHLVEEATAEALNGTDIAFFSAGSGTSKALAPQAAAQGTVVIDNSSAFRMDPSVPLVVPEVNFAAVSSATKIVANPNCTAIILLMALAPLRSLGAISRVIVSTYQSASGAGALAMEELKEQTRAVLEGRSFEPKVMPHPYAFNLFSHNTAVNEEGWNEEEWKVRQEARKILDMPDLPMNVTCVRVPVLRAHAESVTVEFDGPAPSEDQVREVWSRSPGVRIVDDRAANHFPMPLEASGQGDVLAGRIRRDQSHPSALSFFVAGDQLLKGAALNAVQIAERMIAAGHLG